MKVFISYAHQDGKNYAHKLEKELKKQHVGIWIDNDSIKPGKLWLKSIDKGLHDTNYFLAVITHHYLQSVGGEEAYVKLSESFSKREETFIPLFFIPPNEVESPIMRAINGFDFSENFNDGFRDLLRFLISNDDNDYLDLISTIESKESPNPFRRVRAEYFYDDYSLLALAFAEPEREKYDTR